MTKNTTTRRDFLKNTGTALAVAAASAVPAVVAADSPDPVVTLYAAYERAEAHANAINAKWAPLQDQLGERELLFPRVQIGEYWVEPNNPGSATGTPIYVYDEADIPNVTGADEVLYPGRVARFRKHKADCDTAAEALGLPALWKAQDEADDALSEAIGAVFDATPTTARGLALQMRLFLEYSDFGVGMGDKPDGEATTDLRRFRRLLTDAERLANT
jgi:hypothetical protein